jgi:hypothetical protein
LTLREISTNDPARTVERQSAHPCGRFTALLSHRCRNGTLIEIRPASTRITLPTGETVIGEAQHTAEQRHTARRLGYGDDVLAMVRDHDPLHSLLAAWLGLPASYGIMAAAGLLKPEDADLAAYEEAAVLAVQRFMRAAGKGLPL